MSLTARYLGYRPKPVLWGLNSQDKNCIRRKKKIDYAASGRACYHSTFEKDDGPGPGSRLVKPHFTCPKSIQKNTMFCVIYRYLDSIVYCRLRLNPDWHKCRLYSSPQEKISTTQKKKLVISISAMNPLTALPDPLREPHNRVLSRRQELTDCDVVSN